MFDGTTTQMTPPNVVPFSQMTFSMWVNNLPNAAPPYGVASINGSCGTRLFVDSYGNYRVVWNGAGILAASGSGGTFGTSTNLYGAWYQIAYVVDNTNVYAYINGVLQASTTREYPNQSCQGNIQMFFYGNAFVAPGIVEGIRLYNTALSPSAIAGLYAAGR
jgi:hypothetical protein